MNFLPHVSRRGSSIAVVAAIHLALSTPFLPTAAAEVEPAQAPLKVDFSHTGVPVQSGFQGYFATHEVGATFTAQNFPAFGTTVTVAPTWAPGAVNEAKQMYDRGSAASANNFPTDAQNLLRDWIGTDSRVSGDPLTVTLTGLPAGAYFWKSWHHDTFDQRGVFNVTVNDADGARTISGVPITSGATGVNTLADASTLETVIHSNGGPVSLVFWMQNSGPEVNLKLFAMNGFQLELPAAEVSWAPSPADGQSKTSHALRLQWSAPLTYAPSRYEVYFGTNSNVSANPKYEVGKAEFLPPTALAPDTRYYWKVVSYDGSTAQPGPDWTFVTAPPVSRPADIDRSVAICDQMVKTNFSSVWAYQNGLFLEGMWRVYKRTGDTRYLNYIKAWADKFVTDAGLIASVGNNLNSLDNLMPGVLFCHLYQETGAAKYKKAAEQMRARFLSYPRTTDGGLIHNTGTDGQLWLDGAFMLSIFLVNYAVTFDDPSALEDAAKQLDVYYSHLRYVKNQATTPATTLGWHAWDETPAGNSWANQSTGLSPEGWCRAIGWFVVACTEVLEVLPADHSRRSSIELALRELLMGVKAYQEPVTGLWYEVMDKPSQGSEFLDNWVEQSSGCMFTYAMARALDSHLVTEAAFGDCLRTGFEGLIGNIEIDRAKNVRSYGTCEGTNVGPSYAFYIGRKQVTNDLHGLGAFLIASEAQQKRYPVLRRLVQAEDGALRRGLVESLNRGFTGAAYVNFDNEVGSSLDIPLTVANAADYTLTVRYANGGGSPRHLAVKVNGVSAAADVSFPATGAFTAWRGVSLTVPLRAGANLISLESIDATGGPNVDWVAARPLALTIGAGETHVITGPEEYASISNAGTLTLAGGQIYVIGNLFNSGTFRLVDPADVELGSGLINAGIVDVINWSGEVPAGLSGKVLDGSALLLQSARVDGDEFRVIIDGHTGHSYRLQRPTIVSPGITGWEDVGSSVTGTGLNGIGVPIELSSSGVSTRNSEFFRVSVGAE